jgi:hypothetical protein
VYFDATPLSPSQTSLLSLAEFNAFAAKRGGLDFATPVLNADGDYQIAVSGALKTIASSRAAVHGGVEGDWYYLDFPKVFVADTANTAATAMAAGRDVVLCQALSRASMLFSSLPEMCGFGPHFRQRDFTGAITADATNQQFTAAAALNAFAWADYATENKIALSGFAIAQNNGVFTVTAIDTSADPHTLTVSAALADEAATAALSFTYEPGLNFPRNWYPAPYTSNVTPRAIKDAAAVLTINLLRGDVLGEANGQADRPVKKVEIYQAVSVEFMQNSASDTRLYMNDEVLHLLSPYLCTPIRGYGRIVADENLIETGVFDE